MNRGIYDMNGDAYDEKSYATNACHKYDVSNGRSRGSRDRSIRSREGNVRTRDGIITVYVTNICTCTR